MAAPPSQQQVDEWFPRDRDTPPGTFEIGLVLAGGGSAGAYTAGVLDFLVEALDAWTRARLDDDAAGRTGENATVPHHDVLVKIITGASAGGMNGAIAAAALRDEFPSARGGTPAATESSNPFYEAWVRGIDIANLLDLSDLKQGDDVASLLNSEHLAAIVKKVLAIDNPRIDRRVRKWLDNPLPVALTVTNLRGVPYDVMFRGGGDRRHGMMVHRDHVDFAAVGLSERPKRSLPPQVRELPPDHNADVWQALGMAALATGAFPVMLRSRALARRFSDYDFRNPFHDETAVAFGPPTWPPQSNGDADEYRFLCVDGGAMNNEPFDLAHVALAGLFGSNPRDGLKANRAVVMVDPFVDRGVFGPAKEASVVNTTTGLLAAYKDQARFSSGDWALIRAGEIYSRFLIAPSRSEVDGSGAITCGGLAGFMGFFSEAYRRHDFMLGRRNCQWFLKTVFTLPKENPLFQGRWPAASDQLYADAKDPTHRQIIPCVGACSEEERKPPWPRKAFEPDEPLGEKIRIRTREVTRRLLERQLQGARAYARPLIRLYLWPVVYFGRRRLVELAVEGIGTEAERIDAAFPND